MQSKSISNLFQSVSRDSVGLIDSLSVLAAITDLNNVQSEAELHSKVLSTILENQNIEHAALFLKEGELLVLQATAAWDNVGIISRQRKTNWNSHDISFDQGTVGRSVSSGEIVSEQCKKLPDFFIQLHEEVTDQHQDQVVGYRDQLSSMVCIPLKKGDEAYGVLCLHHCEREFFKTSHEHFFTLLAKFFVQILLNYRYTHDLNNQIKERTEQLEDALKVARKLQRDFRELALIDELTGLPNRRFFCDQSQNALSRAARYQRAFSCCIIEIKYKSKPFGNDGILADDQRLQALADILKMQVREADILAHLRGNQFIMSLPENDAKGAMQFAERIDTVMKDVGKKTEFFESISLYIGLATLESSVTTSSEEKLKELMTNADRALAAAKAASCSVYHADDLSSEDLDISQIS